MARSWTSFACAVTSVTMAGVVAASCGGGDDSTVAPDAAAAADGTAGGDAATGPDALVHGGRFCNGLAYTASCRGGTGSQCTDYFGWTVSGVTAACPAAIGAVVGTPCTEQASVGTCEQGVADARLL